MRLPSANPRRIARRLGLSSASLAVLLATVALAWADRAGLANELAASGDAGGLVIHGAAETLAAHSHTDAEGRLWLDLPGGSSFELVTSTSDPAIANPGDGAFHPFDVAEVQAALAEVRYPTVRLRADVFILPYPRRNGLESAAGAGLILLAPGVRPLSPERQHAEFVHELGHIVQRALMPDADAPAWQDYRSLRGIADEAVFAASASHANRPHEIFAEDFRALFGGVRANYSGTIENAAIAPPAAIPGLGAFFLGLAGMSEVSTLSARPNPARGPVELSRVGGTASRLDVFDAQGRRVASLEPTSTAGFARWVWDGRDGDGRRAGPGVYFARARDGGGGVARVTVEP